MSTTPPVVAGGAPSRGHCLLVLGTHRSGTSMTAGVAQLAGFQFGAPLGGPAFDNPRGFFEHLDVSRHHDRLLAEVGLRWHDVGDPIAMASAEQLSRWRVETEALLVEVADGLPMFCCKDPRMLRFLPLWHDALRAQGRVVRHLVAVRDPRDVVASLMRRDSLSSAEATAMWLFDHETMARHLRGHDAPVSIYAEAVADPARLLAVLDTLGAPDAAGAADTVAAFVTRDLDHGTDPVDGEVAIAAARPVYEAIVAAGTLAPLIERA